MAQIKDKDYEIGVGSILCVSDPSTFSVRLVKLVGSGAEGQIFTAQPISSASMPSFVAVKLCQRPSKYKTKSKSFSVSLSNERHMLNQLVESDCGPKYFGWGQVFSHAEFLVFSLHANSLLKEHENDAFSPKECFLIALDCLRELKMLHSKGYVFCDVSPSNFVFRTKPLRHEKALSDWKKEIKMFNLNVVLIDFGCAETFEHTDHFTGERHHRNDVQWKNFKGTPLFASQRALEGWTPARRDDLEALAFVLFYFAGIPLAKETVINAKVSKSELKSMALYRSNLDNLILKSSFSKKALQCIKEFIQTCRNYRFDEEPNYTFLESILIKAIALS